jgi:hypothetical protein
LLLLVPALITSEPSDATSLYQFDWWANEIASAEAQTRVMIASSLYTRYREDWVR